MTAAPALSASAQVHAATGESACVVEDATLTWGFKESFRSYISGTIARGEWTVAEGAEYETPSFRFRSGSGWLGASSMAGSVSFPGAITFTGHDGILNTTLANLVVDFSDDYLLADVSGTTQEGAEVNQKAVKFVALDFNSAEMEGDAGKTTLIDVPATLTDAGAAAFGTYQAGEPFDPLTIELDYEGECAPAVPGTNWAPWIVGGVSLLVIVALAIFLLRRRASAAR